MAIPVGDQLSAVGFPYPLTLEILTQIAAHVGNANFLTQLGLPYPAALEVAALITAHAAFSAAAVARLVSVGINPTAADILVNAAV